jgi:hypothetical protein
MHDIRQTLAINGPSTASITQLLHQSGDQLFPQKFTTSPHIRLIFLKPFLLFRRDG